MKNDKQTRRIIEQEKKRDKARAKREAKERDYSNLQKCRESGHSLKTTKYQHKKNIPCRWCKRCKIAKESTCTRCGAVIKY